MIAARCRDDAAHMRPLAPQPFGVDQTTAYLEGTVRRVVLVLDPHLGAGAFSQQWPSILWRAGKALVHHRQCSFEFGQSEHVPAPKAEAGRCRRDTSGNDPLQWMDADTVRRV